MNANASMNAAVNAEMGNTAMRPRLIPEHPALWRGSDLARTRFNGISSGLAALDAELPGGGWPVGALTEILPAHEGIGELRLLGPALAGIAAQGQHLVWVAPPHAPYAPALSATGIDLRKLLIVRTTCERDTLWATEQALASNTCGAVLAWLPQITGSLSAASHDSPQRDSRKSSSDHSFAHSPAARYPALRRLQLAAEHGQSLALLFRPPGGEQESSPAALRIALSTRNGGLAVRIFKRRGGTQNRTVLLPASPLLARRAVTPVAPASPRSRSASILAGVV